MVTHRRLLATLILLLIPSLAAADEVIFKNGDRLTGTIKSVDGKKLKIDTKVAGVVEVKLDDVQTFSTDSAVQTRLNDKTILHDPIASQGAPATQPVTGPAQVNVGSRAVAVSDIKRVNV